MKVHSVVTAILFTSLLGACASKEAKAPEQEAPQPVAGPAKVTTEPSQEARYAANENDAAFVSEVIFAKGSSNLSKAARKSLDELIAKSKATSALDQVKIIAWADSEYPSVHTKKLSSGQIRLAKRRTEVLQKVFKDVGVKVELFNMAERPTGLSSLLQTDNARIKKSLEIAGIPNTDTSVKTPSKAGHGIVMVILKD